MLTDDDLYKHVLDQYSFLENEKRPGCQAESSVYTPLIRKSDSSRCILGMTFILTFFSLSVNLVYLSLSICESPSVLKFEFILIFLQSGHRFRNNAAVSVQMLQLPEHFSQILPHYFVFTTRSGVNSWCLFTSCFQHDCHKTCCNRDQCFSTLDLEGSSGKLMNRHLALN